MSSMDNNEAIRVLRTLKNRDDISSEDISAIDTGTEAIKNLEVYQKIVGFLCDVMAEGEFAVDIIDRLFADVIEEYNEESSTKLEEYLVKNIDDLYKEYLN